MPSGPIHDRITLWSLPPVGSLVFLGTQDGELTLIACGGYLLGGLMLGPDLDIYSRQFQRWGVFRSLWIPYQRALRHRSFWSHGFLVGTTLRLVYLGLWGLLLGSIGLGLWVAIGQLHQGLQPGLQPGLQSGLHQWLHQGGQILGGVGRSIREHPLALAMAYGGLEAGAMSHSLSDWLDSTRKRYRRQGWAGLWGAATPPPRRKKKRRPQKSKAR